MGLLSTFSKKKIRKTIGVSNGLEPNQDILFVGPGKGAHCLQRLSADGNRRRLQGNNTDLKRKQK